MQLDQSPVDRLAAIRREVRLLLAEAKDLRCRIMMGQVSSIGTHYKAEVRQHLVIVPLETTAKSVPEWLT